jgi:proteasome lid subunit RPN8/RPN11
MRHEEPNATRMTMPRHVIDRITAHARAEQPNECCGLLLGADEHIDEAVPARNLHASSSRFLVNPVDHLAAVRRARATGRRVVGAYHSHPETPPVPSPRDLEEATYTEFVYLICGPVRHAEHGPIPVRAWRLANEIPSLAHLRDYGAPGSQVGPAGFVEVQLVVIG